MKSEKFYGHYNGWVLDDADPEMAGKVKVYCPSVHSHLKSMVETPRINDGSGGLFAGMSREEIEELKELCPWAVTAQPLIGAGGSGYDYGGNGLYSGDGRISTVSDGNVVTAYSFALNTDGVGKQTTTGQSTTASGISNRDKTILGYTIPLERDAFQGGLPKPIFKLGIRPKQPAIVTFTKGGKSVSLLLVATDTGGKWVRDANGNVAPQDKGSINGKSTNVNRDWGELGINTIQRLHQEGMIASYSDSGSGNLKVGGNMTARYDFLEGRITSPSEYKKLESELISQGRLGNDVKGNLPQTQKPAQAYTGLSESEGISENDNGTSGGLTVPQNFSSYKEFISSLGLKNITADQVIRAHNRTRGGTRNTTPPSNLWANIVPTLRLADGVAPQLGGISSINSMYRSPDYNKAVGGASASQHMKNTAMDITFKAGSTKAFNHVCDIRGSGAFFGGVGWYPSFLHIDTRGTNNTWGRSGCAGAGLSGQNQCDAFTNVGNRSEGENLDIQIFEDLDIDPEKHPKAKQIIEINKKRAELQKLYKASAPLSTESVLYDKQLKSTRSTLENLWNDFQFGDETQSKWNSGWNPLSHDYTKETNNTQANPSAKNYGSTPFSNTANGTFSIPKTGSRVYVFFEDGDPSSPVVAHNNPPAEAYNSIYNTNSPTSHYPDGDGTKHATRMGSRGGGISIIDTHGKEGVQIGSYQGDEMRLSQEGTTRMATKNDSLLVKGDQFSTIRGNHNIHVDGDSDNMYSNRYDKYGDVRNNFKMTEKILELIRPLHDSNSLFDLQRAIYNGDDMSMSPLQKKSGENKACPYCNGENKQKVIKSEVLGKIVDAVATGARNVIQKIKSGDGYVEEQSVSKDECLNCGGTGISQSSREGDFQKEPEKYGDVDPTEACLEILKKQYDWLEQCKGIQNNSIYECKIEETRVKTHIDDKGRAVATTQTILKDKYDTLKSLGFESDGGAEITNTNTETN